MNKHGIRNFAISFGVALATITAIQLVRTYKPSPLKYATEQERLIIEKFLVCVHQNKDPLVEMTEDELEVLVRFEVRTPKALLPAPIPLTPELDKKLADEGILPLNMEEE